MGIYLDHENDATVCVCNRCQAQFVTNRANGVVPQLWMTGHLWLDVSLSEQRQVPICFCPDCSPVLVDGSSYKVDVEF